MEEENKDIIEETNNEEKNEIVRIRARNANSTFLYWHYIYNIYNYDCKGVMRYAGNQCQY